MDAAEYGATERLRNGASLHIRALVAFEWPRPGAPLKYLNRP